MEKVYYFLYSYWGMYLTQAVFHSVVAGIIADCCIVAWKIIDPVRRQILRIGVIVVPIVAYPLYQFINPERGSIYFRQDALMDTSRWLLLELWGRIPLIWFFVLVLFLASLIFLIQEFLPVLIHTIGSIRERVGEGEDVVDEDDEDEEVPESYSETIIEVLDSLPGDNPEVEIIDDYEMIIFSSTGRVPVVYISTAIIDAFDREQLRGAIAHEIAHIRRTRKPVLTFLFVFRVIMFFNPVALFEFRRAVQDEEEICDDEAVRSTGNPSALASALEKFVGEHRPRESHEPHGQDESQSPQGSLARESTARESTARESTAQESTAQESHAEGAIEQYSHDMLLKKRIDRLNEVADNGGEIFSGGGSRMAYSVFALGALVINYLIV